MNIPSTASATEHNVTSSPSNSLSFMVENSKLRVVAELAGNLHPVCKQNEWVGLLDDIHYQNQYSESVLYNHSVVT